MSQDSFDTAGASKASARSYVVGFVAAVACTAFAFGMVIYGKELPRPAIMMSIFGVALLQIFVHLHFFLHLDLSQSQRWNVISLIFTILIAILFGGGTLWVIADLNYRMM